ncbi:MAG: DNA (cytosine-5-)-methyltransferase [Thiolinea sp.]
MNTPTFTFIDLFAGIGGFRLALDKLGGKCLHFSEIHSDAINTYCANFKEDSSLNLGDITKVKQLPPHDILTAGVPCQSWSIAGKNLGFDDDRGQLWNDTLYLLNQSRPKAFIFENVTFGRPRAIRGIVLYPGSHPSGWVLC